MFPLQTSPPVKPVKPHSTAIYHRIEPLEKSVIYICSILYLFPLLAVPEEAQHLSLGTTALADVGPVAVVTELIKN